MAGQVKRVKLPLEAHFPKEKNVGKENEQQKFRA